MDRILPKDLRRFFAIMHLMKKKLLFVSFILLFAGCSTSRFVNTADTLTLIHNEIILSKKLKTIKSTHKVFSPLYLTIEIKEDPKTKTYFAYEEARVHGSYIFDYSEKVLVHKIFKPTYSKQLLRLNNLTLFYLRAKNRNFYLIVNQNSKRKLQFVYPLSYEQVTKIVEQLDSQAVVKIEKQESFQATSPNDLPLSSWSPAILIIETIVKKQGGRNVGR